MFPSNTDMVWGWQDGMEIEIYELLMLDAQTARAARAARQLWIQEFDPSKSSQRVGKLEQIHIWQHYIYCYMCIYVHIIVFPMYFPCLHMRSLQVIFQWSLGLGLVRVALISISGRFTSPRLQTSWETSSCPFSPLGRGISGKRNLTHWLM